FRRVFLLLIATVCVPSLALSTFGILAIKAERAVVEKQLEDIYGSRLDRLAEVLAAQVAQPENARAPDADELAAQVQLLGRQMFPGEKARFELVSLGPPEGREDVVKSLMRSITGSRADQSSGEWSPPIVERPLTGALAGNALVVRLAEGSSAASLALFNRVLYGALLFLLYAAIAVGVVLTSRAVYREARLSRLKSDFVSHVGHELRTPLTSIRMFVETLRLGRVRSEAEREQCLDMLDKEAERLSGLVDRILDWARIETGRKVYRKIAAMPGELAKEAVEIFDRQQLAPPGLVRVEIPDGLPDVEVDRDAIEVVLFNLLMNAHKYTGKDKEISLRLRHAGKRVHFEVVDNGPGIPSSERKRIFEHFYRVDDLLTRRTEGTGLGLAISKRIAEDHGGRIDVAGEVGKGSRFILVLPAAQEVAA
ncbi:MAG TPA: ATP-binding protein, partial [Vulgatibacter sp.]